MIYEICKFKFVFSSIRIYQFANEIHANASSVYWCPLYVELNNKLVSGIKMWVNRDEKKNRPPPSQRHDSGWHLYNNVLPEALFEYSIQINHRDIFLFEMGYPAGKFFALTYPKEVVSF